MIKWQSPSTKMVGGFFCAYIPLGFANCQPILYISNVGEYHVPTTAHNYSNEYGLGFAKCQPLSYIEDINKNKLKQIRYEHRQVFGQHHINK